MQPKIMGAEPILVPESPSPWWHWGLAIGIMLMVFLAAIGLLMSTLFPVDGFMQYYPEPESPGPFPENGTLEEQNEWNQSNYRYEEWNQTNSIFDSIKNSGMYETQILVGSLTVISAIPVITLLVIRHKWAFRAATLWIIFKSILESILAMEVQYMMDDIFSHFPKETPLPPTWIYSLSGIFQIICCNLSLLCIVVICSTKTSEQEVVPSSGFHINLKEIN